MSSAYQPIHSISGRKDLELQQLKAYNKFARLQNKVTRLSPAQVLKPSFGKLKKQMDAAFVRWVRIDPTRWAADPIHDLRSTSTMAKARKKTAKKTTHRKARKKTAKRTVKKTSKTTRKRRTPAQVAATKRLVAYNKKHHGKKAKRKTSHRKGEKRTAYSAEVDKAAARLLRGAPMYSHPLSPAQYNLAAREAMATGLAGHLHVGRKRKGRNQVHQIVSVGGRHAGHFENFGPVRVPKKHRRKAATTTHKVAKKHHATRNRKHEVVTAEQIINKAKIGAKQHKIKMWICAGPRRTGCGGGKRGGHVRGIIS